MAKTPDPSDPAGYEAGLSAETSEGEVQVGVSVESAADSNLAVGISVTAPRVGSLSAGILVDEEGAARLGWLTRVDEDGRPTPEIPTVEARLRARGATLEEQLTHEKARADASEEAVARLQEAVDAARGGREAAELRARDSEERLALLERSAGAARSEIGSLVKRLGDAEGANADLREKEFEWRETGRELEAVRGNLEAAETRVAELSARLDEARSSGQVIADEVDSLREELDAARTNADTARREAEESNAAAQRFETELKATRELASARQGQLEADTHQRDEELFEARESARVAEEKARALEAELEALRADHEELEHAEAQLQTAMTGLEDENQGTQSRLSQAIQKAAELEAANQDLELRLAESTARLETLDDLQRQLDEAEVRVGKMVAERSALKTELLFLKRKAAGGEGLKSEARPEKAAPLEHEDPPQNEDITAVGLDMSEDSPGPATDPVPGEDAAKEQADAAMQTTVEVSAAELARVTQSRSEDATPPPEMTVKARIKR